MDYNLLQAISNYNLIQSLLSSGVVRTQQPQQPQLTAADLVRIQAEQQLQQQREEQQKQNEQFQALYLQHLLASYGQNVESQTLSAFQPFTATTVQVGKVTDNSQIAVIEPSMLTETDAKLGFESNLKSSTVIGRDEMAALIQMQRQSDESQSVVSVETPSFVVDDQRPSPSTSATTTLPSKDDEDEELFVDVESVDNRPDGKLRRKAHIEFYRKIKSIRHREKMLRCAICEEKVINNDSSIHEHVNRHAGAGGFRCRICGTQSLEKPKMYEHMRSTHPKKMDCFEDLRDMTKMCTQLLQCFPRAATAKTRKDSKDSDSFFASKLDPNVEKVNCLLCPKQVPANKNALTRHANTHPSFRCKSCHFVTFSTQDQNEHQTKVHQSQNPQLSVDYNVCSAAEVVQRNVERCFFNTPTTPTE